jgi:hypothetical protein
MNAFKKIIFAAFLLSGSYICFAQEISIRGGFNLSRMLEKYNGEIITDNPKLNPGFHAGPIICFHFTNNLSFETGILYSTKGLLRKGYYGPSDPKYSWRLNVSYLEAPAKVKVSIPVKKIILFGTAGGYFAYGLSGTLLERENISDKTGIWHKVDWDGTGISMKRFDCGFDFGIGARLKCTEFGVCYQRGLLNISNSSDNFSGFNKNLEIYLSYKLWNLKSKTKIKTHERKNI